MITVYPADIPEEGLHLSGSLQKDIFQLDEKDEAQSAGPTSYDFDVTLSDDIVLIQGQIAAPFTLRCVVCLEIFPFTNRIENYLADFEQEGSGPLELVERLREDLLLNLPTYPHCDEGDDPESVCPMEGQITKPEPDSGEPKPSAWDALDELDPRGKTGD